MKKMILLLIALMVISVGLLSGCTETTDDTDDDAKTDYSDKVELVSHKIETYGRNDSEYMPPYFIGDGFNHSEKALLGYYQITGTIKNNAGVTLNNITIKIDFFDKNHTYLDSEYSESKNIFSLPLPDNETADFKINYIYSQHKSYFEGVEEIEFNFSAIQ
jgi:hypothetical protein